jgi:[acyl-carrier-protein] S-malonyltransferase
MIAFIFPGQGAQKVGMGKALADAHPICQQTFQEADAALGEPLSRIIFGGPEDQLTLTENTQPAILTVSIAAYRLLESRGIKPAFVAGHSLGEYSANVAAGTFSFADALRLVRRRGRFMQEAVPVGEGAMAAIIGLEADAVAQACAEAANGQVVVPANLNGGGQVVIAGARDAVARGQREGENDGRAARDPVAGECAVSLRIDAAGAGSAGAGASRGGGSRSARAGDRKRRRRTETRSVGRCRGAGPAGVGAGPLGSSRATPCVGRRHNVC